MERVVEGGLIDESSRARGREGRREDRIGMVGEEVFPSVRESDSRSVRCGDVRDGLASGSEVPPAAESVWSTERFKCKRFRIEASRCSTAQEAEVVR